MENFNVLSRLNVSISPLCFTLSVLGTGTLLYNIYTSHVSGAVLTYHSDLPLLNLSWLAAARIPMALSSAHFLIDQLSGPAAILLQILPGLLLPTGWSSLAVSAGVSSLAGAFIVPPAPACTVS